MHMTMHVRMPKATLIVAAISSRPYVKAALEAGFEVLAMDAFIDVDTQKLAKNCYKLSYDNEALQAETLLAVLDVLDLTDVDGFCFGAGFEKNPDLLSQINLRLPVFGNSVEAIKQCKSPMDFFALCDAYGMLYPVYSMQRPKQSEGWIKKKIGGSGGQHISHLTDSDVTQAGVYYQQLQQGTSMSCLFLADKQQVQLIGINEQWVQADMLMPYRYGGCASKAFLSATTTSHLTGFLTMVVQKLGLLGLNSCDFILHHEDIYMLEINPRLSASMDLYQALDGGLFAAHLAACKGGVVKPVATSANAKAQQVVYAQNDMVISDKQHWPAWVSDIPQAEQQIAAGMPICTVSAEADNMEQAKQLVQTRAVFI
jgi:uncharacterized protein